MRTLWLREPSIDRPRRNTLTAWLRRKRRRLESQDPCKDQERIEPPKTVDAVWYIHARHLLHAQ